MDSGTVEKYFLNADREKAIWKDCVFVFDTAALLNFYNYSPATKAFIFENVFPKLKGRLWIPHQVEFEYLKNRIKTLKNPINEKYGQLKSENISQLEEHFNKFSNQINNVKSKTKLKFSHPYFDQNIFEDFDKEYERFKEKLGDLTKRIEEQIEERTREILSVEAKDDVLAGFTQHLQSGKPMPFQQLLDIAKEGTFRYTNKIPPGYEDAEAKSGKIGLQIYGDLFIWKQTLEYGRVVNKPIVFVTDDVKADWCYAEKQGSETRISRPREELIKEIFDYTGVDFWMYTLAQFLFNVEQYYGVKIEEQVFAEVESSAKQDLLVFDNLYVHRNDRYVDCLKFFENEKVISTSIVTELQPESIIKINKWFNQDYSRRTGKYKITDGKLNFTVKGERGEVDYNGTIKGRQLVLDSHSKINGHKATRTYELL